MASTATTTSQTILLPESGSEAVTALKELNRELKLPVKFDEMSLEAALQQLEDGAVAAVITGATLPSSEVIGAGIKKFNPRRNSQGEIDEEGIRKTVSSFFVFEKEGREPFVLADGAVNVDPSPTTLVEIASQTCASVTKLGIEPRVAFLSYSTLGSGKGQSPEKVVAATKLFTEEHPDIPTIGEVQFDAATDEHIYELKTGKKYPSGVRPNVFIVPNLDVGNILYKALQSKYFGGGWTAIGPLLQGFEQGRQLHDLSRGVTADALAKIVEYVARLSAVPLASRK